MIIISGSIHAITALYVMKNIINMIPIFVAQVAIVISIVRVIFGLYLEEEKYNCSEPV